MTITMFEVLADLLAVALGFYAVGYYMGRRSERPR